MKQQDNICTKSFLVFIFQLSSLSLCYYDRTADTQRTEKMKSQISFSAQERLIYFSFYIKEFYWIVSSKYQPIGNKTWDETLIIIPNSGVHLCTTEDPFCCLNTALFKLFSLFKRLFSLFIDLTRNLLEEICILLKQQSSARGYSMAFQKVLGTYV